MLTIDDYFPNKQYHAWTHGGVYYCITTDGEIFGSNNKFKYDSFRVGYMPSRAKFIYGNSGGDYEQLIETNAGDQDDSIYRSILVQGGNIFVEAEVIVEGELVTQYYISRSYGATWVKLNNIPSSFTGYSDPSTNSQWRRGAFAFMTIDSRSCHCYFYKPLLKEQSDGTQKLVNWYVHRSDDTIIHDPTSNVMNTIAVEDRFRSGGSAKESFTNRLNNMDTHLEEDRKPYILRWPTIRGNEGGEGDAVPDPETIDRSTHLVNPCDTVIFNHDAKTYAIVRIPQELTVRTGLLANNENNYLPDYLTTRVPIFYVINVDNLERGTSFEKCPIRVIDLVGFDQFLAPLHSAQFTLRQGVYSYLSGLLGKDFSLEVTYGAAGTVYDYSANSEEVFPERPNFAKFRELISGDLLKITDPGNGKDIAAFLSRNRVKVCLLDPTKEYNWVDKSTESTYVRPFQKARASESILILTEDIENKATPVFNSWCAYDTVLRYDYEDNKVLGYPMYDNTAVQFDRDTNLVGYTFPSVVKSNGNYSIGTVRKSDTSVLVIDTGIAQYTDVMDDEPTNVQKTLWYGGFVGSERGYIGSLERYVVGIDVPPEPEYPPAPVPPVTEPPGAPLPVPSTIALIDDIKKSVSAVVAPSRRAVSFGTAAGAAITNLGVNDDKWYVEITNIASDKVYFGMSTNTLDVTKEPGEDANVIAVGMDGSVRRGGRLIYRTPAPLYNPNASNNIIAIKIDMVNRLLSFTDGQGVWSSVAIAGMPKGVVYFFMGASPTQVGENSLSMNFGQVPFEYTVPNNYISGYGLK